MTKKKEDKGFYEYLDETMNKKPKPNPKNKKKSKVEELTGKTRKEIEKEYQESLKRIDEYLKKPRKRKSNQMDRSNPRGIDIKDGGMPMPKPKPKRTITKKQLDSLPRNMVDVLKQGVNKKTPLDSLPRDMIGVLKMLAKKQLTQDEERKLKKSAKTDSRIVKEDTPPKPKRKPTGPSPRRGKGLKGGGTFRVLKKGVVRGSYS